MKIHSAILEQVSWCRGLQLIRELIKNIVVNGLCQLQVEGWGTVYGGQWSTWNQGCVRGFISFSLQNGRILAFLGIR